MKILLIQPPFEDFYATPIRHYPLGLLYAASALREAGCEVRVLDCLSPLQKRSRPVPREMAYLEPYLREPLFFKGYHRFGLSEDQIIRRIREFGPGAIGISSQFTAYYQSVEELARMIKREFGLPIFVGGHHATAFPEEIRRRTPESPRPLDLSANDNTESVGERRRLCANRRFVGKIQQIPGSEGPVESAFPYAPLAVSGGKGAS